MHGPTHPAGLPKPATQPPRWRRWRAVLIALLPAIALAACSSTATRSGSSAASRPSKTAANKQAAESRMRQRFSGVRGAEMPTQPSQPSRYGLADRSSEQELAEALAPKPTPKPLRAQDGLQSFNVLTRALIDPQTGELTLQGETDPRYATGPLPYAAWLADAIRHPHPVFSLDPPAGASTPPQLDADLSRLARDEAFAIAWLKRLLDPVTQRQPQLGEAERQLLDHRLRSNLGIAPEEHQAYADWMRAGKKNFASVQQYYLARMFMGKLLAGVGAPRSTGIGIMAVLRSMQDPNPATGLDIYVQLGRVEEFQDIRRRRQANEIDAVRAGALLTAAYGEPILRGLGCPEPRVRELVDRIRAGGEEDALLAELNRRWEEKSREALLAKVLHGFRYSSAFLSQTYRLPPVLSSVNLHGAPADSQLMRALFAGDEALKYLVSAAPETQAVGFQQFLVDRTGRQNLRLPRTGMNRYWIAPGRVELRELPLSGGVGFGPAQLQIRAESLQSDGSDAAGAAAFRQALSDYAAQLTAQYDSHARALPSLHALREASKIIALAHWLQSERLRPEVSVQPASRPMPAQIQGFWGLTFLVQPTGDSDSLVYWAQGGVTFAQQEGDAWVAAQPAQAQDNDTLRQLAASTALAEKAVAAAASGDLEAARDLAEKSAQAMTGKLDLSLLPALPVAEPLPPQPGAVQLGVATAAIQVVDQQTQQLAQAKARTASAQAQQPPDAAEIAAADQSSQRALNKLTRLQNLLAAYRQTPVQARQLRVEIQALASEPPAPAQDRVAQKPQALPQQATLTAAAAPPPEAKPAPPAAQPLADAQPLPDAAAECARLAGELASLRSELSRVSAALMRLNRSIQSDQQQLADWAQEADAASKRANQRLVDFARDQLIGRGLKVAKRYCETAGLSTADCVRQVDALEKLSETTKLAEWGTRKDPSWTYVLEGTKELLDRLPLGERPKAFLMMTEHLMNSAYDISAWMLSYQAIRQLEANSEAFLKAVDSSSLRMRLIVAQIREIAATPHCNLIGAEK